MKSIKIIMVVFFAVSLLAGSAYAKDLKGRLGVGFSSQLTLRGHESISAKYWLNNDLGFQGMFGFVSGDDYDELDIGGKVLFKIKDEENLHVDAFGGMGLISYDSDQDGDDTGFAISGGLAIEYFFSGLPNLGFSSEIGMAFVDRGDNSSFETMGETFITAGIHYYFDFMAPPADQPIQ